MTFFPNLGPKGDDARPNATPDATPAVQPEAQPDANPEESRLISRRAVLQYSLAGLAVGALGYSRFAKPQPTPYQLDRLTLPQRLDRPQRVTVVGGGLAGLAASYELSQRGFAVTLIERAPQLGGKIASWDIEVNGESLRMEHGFHGFFPQYYNLWALTEELGIGDNFLPLERYSVVYHDTYAPEVFRPSSSAFPWNIVDLAISSPNRLRWGLNLASPAHWAVFRAITGFHPQKTYAELDAISVTEWAAKDFPRGLYDLYFLPFGKSTLNSPDVLSAGELMQFFHFYFFGNPEGLAFNGTKQDMGRSLVDPLAAAIRQNGGQVLTGTEVTQVNWREGKITSLEHRPAGSASPTPFWVDRHVSLNGVDLAANPEPERPEYFGGGDEVYAVRGDRALSLTCTHQGCTVVPQTDGSYRCPCHGACFDAAGRVTQGPAKANLAEYRVKDRAQVAAGPAANTQDKAGDSPGDQPVTGVDRVQLAAVHASAVASQTLEADYVVFAADVRGIGHLFDLAHTEKPEDIPAPLVQQVAELKVADPFAVLRIWFDRDFPWPHSEFASFSGYRLTDSLTRYHKIQADYQAWHERTGGSVVELHAYCYKEAEFPTQESLIETFQSELFSIVPELREAKILHRELVNQKNFSGFPPGSYANRPETRSLAANLMFAGDWVKMPFPCGLMERAISSGLLAANEICHEAGLQRRTLLTVNPQGVLQI